MSYDLWQKTKKQKCRIKKCSCQGSDRWASFESCASSWEGWKNGRSFEKIDPKSEKRRGFFEKMRKKSVARLFCRSDIRIFDRARSKRYRLDSTFCFCNCFSHRQKNGIFDIAHILFLSFVPGWHFPILQMGNAVALGESASHKRVFPVLRGEASRKYAAREKWWLEVKTPSKCKKTVKNGCFVQNARA